MHFLSAESTNGLLPNRNNVSHNATSTCNDTYRLSNINAVSVEINSLANTNGVIDELPRVYFPQLKGGYGHVTSRKRSMSVLPSLKEARVLHKSAKTNSLLPAASLLRLQRDMLEKQNIIETSSCKIKQHSIYAKRSGKSIEDNFIINTSEKSGTENLNISEKTKLLLGRSRRLYSSLKYSRPEMKSGAIGDAAIIKNRKHHNYNEKDLYRNESRCCLKEQIDVKENYRRTKTTMGGTHTKPSTTNTHDLNRKSILIKPSLLPATTSRTQNLSLSDKCQTPTTPNLCFRQAASSRQTPMVVKAIDKETDEREFRRAVSTSRYTRRRHSCPVPSAEMKKLRFQAESRLDWQAVTNSITDSSTLLEDEEITARLSLLLDPQ